VKPPEPPRTRLRHPFRDSAIFYGVLAIVIVIVAALTGGDVAKGVVIGVVFFLAATGWSWWRYRERLDQERGR
jgi:hypothetical protein